jgi:hypothetical protein
MRIDRMYNKAYNCVIMPLIESNLSTREKASFYARYIGHAIVGAAAGSGATEWLSYGTEGHSASLAQMVAGSVIGAAVNTQRDRSFEANHVLPQLVRRSELLPDQMPNQPSLPELSGFDQIKLPSEQR